MFIKRRFSFTIPVSRLVHLSDRELLTLWENARMQAPHHPDLKQVEDVMKDRGYQPDSRDIYRRLH